MSDSETEIETMAEKVMIEKKPKSDGRKKPRTAAQIAATQRLVEATRKRREDAKAKKDAEQYSALKGKFKKDKPKAKPMPVHESSSSEDSSSSSDEEPPATPAPIVVQERRRVRSNLSHFITFKPKTLPEMEAIFNEIMPFKKSYMLDFFDYIFGKKHALLFIDMSLRESGNFEFYKNFNRLTITA